MADLAAVRADVAVFAEQVLGGPLWAHQAKALASTKFITTVASARRTGKTEMIKIAAAWTCFRERDTKVVVLSAGQEASRRITEELVADLAAHDLTRDSVSDGFSTRIRFTNGSEIISLPASQRAVRGLGKGVKLLVLDEAGFISEELWRAAHYVAMDERRNGGRILLTGTPWGGPEMFFRQAYEAGLQGDVDHASFHWTYKANPLLDHPYLERQKSRVSPQEWISEVLGEWSDAVGSMFPGWLLTRQTADVDVPALDALTGAARPLAGLDWGVSFDRTALAMVYRTPCAVLNPGREARPTFVVFPKVWPAGASMNHCAREVAASPVAFSYLATETNGVGAGPSDELGHALGRGPGRGLRLHAVHTSNASKTASYGALLGLMENGQVVLPRHPDLLRQLAGLRIEQGERGFSRISAEDPATHDDVADALSLAMVPYVPRRGKIIRCLLPKFAENFPAEASLHGLVEPVVQTGGGLRVYQRPVLQSVAGLEVSLPADVRRARVTDDKARLVRRAYDAALAEAALANGETRRDG
jgi:hypothetical protein